MKIWSESLCRMDSDGDGKSNGEELGDPNCVWREGDIPQFMTGITHPGLLFMSVKYVYIYCTIYCIGNAYLYDVKISIETKSKDEANAFPSCIFEVTFFFKTK